MKQTSPDYLRCPECTSEFDLMVTSENDGRVRQGQLSCLGCQRTFQINDGIPQLLYPETLAKPELQNKRHHDKHADYNPRRWLLKLGLWKFALLENSCRRQLLKKLELQRGDKVLETGVGNGPNLPIIKKLAGNQVQLDGMDISFETLKVARQKMNAKGVQVEFIEGNGCYLPYKTGRFDAVLHVGALNQFSEKKRAIDEMCRVAKPGGKIVMCDEGLAPGKENTWLGKRLLRMSPRQFEHDPPMDLLPAVVEDLKLSYVWQGTHWLIEFRTKWSGTK